MNIPRFCPNARTAIPNPANCRDTIISGTAAKVAGTMVPAIVPNAIVSTGIIHPVAIKGNTHITDRTAEEMIIMGLRIPSRSER
jgi:hypothetical protein